MRFRRFALKLGMELHCDEVRVAGQFDDFDQAAIGAESRKTDSVGFVLLPIHVVELVPVTVPFGYAVGLISALCNRIVDQVARLGSQSHGASQLGYVALFIEQADHGVWRIFVELGAVGPFKSDCVAPELDGGALHA